MEKRPVPAGRAPACAWEAGPRSFPLDRPLVMGVINITPDSFSDGGLCLDPGKAAARAVRMEGEGADLVDLGAESSRPGSRPVDEAEETARLVPALEKIARVVTVPISVDTRRSSVARRALGAGATVINDISAGSDPGMFQAVSEAGAGLVLMHMRGTPETMQENPFFVEVVSEVRAFLLERAAAAVSAGIPRRRLVIDPGIGFGKTTAHNLLLLSGIGRLAGTGLPVLVGVSRKRFIGEIGAEPEAGRRLPGSLAAACLARLAGASIFRVHDVAETKQALAVTEAIRKAGDETCD